MEAWGCSEAQPQELGTPCGQALKERWSQLWKWNPARIICRSELGQFLAFPGVPLRYTPGYHPGAPSALRRFGTTQGKSVLPGLFEDD